jgi:ribosome-associated protein
MKDPQELLNAIGQALYDKKGLNILALDVHNISTITDYVVIAEGNVDRHVIALARSVMDALNDLGVKPLYVEGLQTGDWVVIDYLQIMVHIFMPGMRDRYQLEQLWKAGSIVDLKFDSSVSSK